SFGYGPGVHSTVSVKDVPRLEELQRDLTVDNLRLWECVNVMRCNPRLPARRVLNDVFALTDQEFFRHYSARSLTSPLTPRSASLLPRTHQPPRSPGQPVSYPVLTNPSRSPGQPVSYPVLTNPSRFTRSASLLPRTHQPLTFTRSASLLPRTHQPLTFTRSASLLPRTHQPPRSPGQPVSYPVLTNPSRSPGQPVSYPVLTNPSRSPGQPVSYPVLTNPHVHQVSQSLTPYSPTPHVHQVSQSLAPFSPSPTFTRSASLLPCTHNPPRSPGQQSLSPYSPTPTFTRSASLLPRTHQPLTFTRSASLFPRTDQPPRSPGQPVSYPVLTNPHVHQVSQSVTPYSPTPHVHQVSQSLTPYSPTPHVHQVSQFSPSPTFTRSASLLPRTDQPPRSPGQPVSYPVLTIPHVHQVSQSLTLYSPTPHVHQVSQSLTPYSPTPTFTRSASLLPRTHQPLTFTRSASLLPRTHQPLTFTRSASLLPRTHQPLTFTRSASLLPRTDQPHVHQVSQSLTPFSPSPTFTRSASLLPCTHQPPTFTRSASLFPVLTNPHVHQVSQSLTPYSPTPHVHQVSQSLTQYSPTPHVHQVSQSLTPFSPSPHVHQVSQSLTPYSPTPHVHQTGHGALSYMAQTSGCHGARYLQHVQMHNSRLVCENGRLLTVMHILGTEPYRTPDEVVLQHVRHERQGTFDRVLADLARLKDEARAGRQRSFTRSPSIFKSPLFHNSRRHSSPPSANGPSTSNNNDSSLRWYDSSYQDSVSTTSPPSRGAVKFPRFDTGEQFRAANRPRLLRLPADSLYISSSKGLLREAEGDVRTGTWDSMRPTSPVDSSMRPLSRVDFSKKDSPRLSSSRNSTRSQILKSSPKRSVTVVTNRDSMQRSPTAKSESSTKTSRQPSSPNRRPSLMAPRFPNSTVYRERPSPAASPEARFQSYPFARNYASSNNASVVACSPGEPSKHDRVEFHEEEDEEDSVPYLKHSARLKKYRSVKLGVKGMAMETAGRHDTKDPSASAVHFERICYPDTSPSANPSKVKPAGRHTSPQKSPPPHETSSYGSVKRSASPLKCSKISNSRERDFNENREKASDRQPCASSDSNHDCASDSELHPKLPSPPRRRPGSPKSSGKNVSFSVIDRYFTNVDRAESSVISPLRRHSTGSSECLRDENPEPMYDEPKVEIDVKKEKLRPMYYKPKSEMDFRSSDSENDDDNIQPSATEMPSAAENCCTLGECESSSRIYGEHTASPQSYHLPPQAIYGEHTASPQSYHLPPQAIYGEHTASPQSYHLPPQASEYTCSDMLDERYLEDSRKQLMELRESLREHTYPEPYRMALNTDWRIRNSDRDPLEIRGTSYPASERKDHPRSEKSASYTARTCTTSTPDVRHVDSADDPLAPWRSQDGRASSPRDLRLPSRSGSFTVQSPRKCLAPSGRPPKSPSRSTRGGIRITKDSSDRNRNKSPSRTLSSETITLEKSVTPPGRPLSPSTSASPSFIVMSPAKMSSPSRVSPTSRLMTSGKVSHSSRLMSPGKVSPSGRVISPGKVSPSSRVISPGKVSPSSRVISPGKVSPSSRVISPGKVSSSSRVMSPDKRSIQEHDAPSPEIITLQETPPPRLIVTEPDKASTSRFPGANRREVTSDAAAPREGLREDRPHRVPTFRDKSKSPAAKSPAAAVDKEASRTSCSSYSSIFKKKRMRQNGEDHTPGRPSSTSPRRGSRVSLSHGDTPSGGSPVRGWETKPYKGPQGCGCTMDKEFGIPPELGSEITELGERMSKLHDKRSPWQRLQDEGKRAKCLGELLSEVERTSTQSGRLEALFDHEDDTLDRRNRSSDSDLISNLELDSTSYERRDKAEKSWDSGRELDWNESSCRRPRELPEAILGEIAFQLERRVLREVFDKGRRSSGGSSSTSCSQQKKSPKGGQRHRFYGYTVSNIVEKVRRECADEETGKRNAIREAQLLRRYRKTMSILKFFGYSVNKHGLLAQNIINKYGLFYQPPDAATIVRLGLHDFRTVRDHVIRMTSGKEREGILVLLNCLHALGSKENQPILSFD
ncbi:hypothetical protein BaRGS_00036016, partial [Batillaria attramentaria]